MTTSHPIVGTTTPDQINKHHERAMQCAGEAVDSARMAGLLLQEVKAALNHGEWLGWLQANVRVSARQAQRYMAVANGLNVPIRELAPASLKNDTLSHLLKTADYIPTPGHWAFCDDGLGAMEYLVEPSAAHPGFFFVGHVLTDGEVECTRRPIRGDWVGDQLSHFGCRNPGTREWHTQPSAGVMAAFETLETIANEMQAKASKVHQ